MDGPPGRLPTHLRVLGPLGSGGSGQVWSARDRRAGRDVALKLVPLGPDGRGGARLDREARGLARLAGHPGVARVYEVGTDGAGLGWLSSELVEGPTLDRLVAGGPQPGPAVAAWVAVLAATLAEVHRAGVVHGDVTPANVVLHPGRGPVLVDFGSAAVGDAGGPPDPALTPSYASPERRRGRPPRPPGDVYGLGATALALLEGHPPDPAALVPRPGPDVPVWVGDCLAVDPRRRPTAAALRDRLAPPAGRWGGGRRGWGGRRRRR